MRPANRKKRAKKKLFATLRKKRKAEKISISVWQTRQHQTSKQQKSAINFVCFTGGTSAREQEGRDSEDAASQRVRKTHLDFSDLIMEIESIIFYTCYEINIV